VNNLKRVFAASAVVALLVGPQVGCYTTTKSREQAKILTTQITGYRDEQAQRVERLNREYADTFNRLMDTLEDLTQVELQQGRDADAQLISDNLIADGKSSLRSRFRGAFGSAVEAQRQRIHEADLAVAAVRENYARSYTEAKLQLSKLKTVLDNLRAVSEENANPVKEATRVIKIFADSYQKAREEAKKQATSGQSSGGGSGS
jgi:nitrate reductase assembly molybdenum cofactor insertion protein NarJ